MDQNFNQESEQALLSLALRNPDVLLDNLKPEDFFLSDHIIIAQAIIEMRNMNFGCDPITISNHIQSTQKRDLFDYLSELYTLSPPVEHAETYARAISEHAYSRHVKQASVQIQRISESPVDAATKRNRIDDLLEKLDENLPESDTFGSAAKGAHDMADIMEKVGTEEGSLMMMGFPDVDRVANGMMPGDFILLAGRPAMGKTALAMKIAENVARPKEGLNGVELAGAGVAVFSMEMSRAQLAGRMVCGIGEIDSKKLRRGDLTGQEWARYAKAVEDIDSLDIQIDQRAGLTVHQIEASTRKLIRRGKKIGLVVIDYLQLMAGEGNNRQEQISGISRGLKAMAKKLNVRVIALSQLSRDLEKRADKRPLMSDLRESGALEQDADLILFVYRDEVYYHDSPNRGEAEIITAKNRAGSGGVSILKFNGPYVRFENKPLIDNSDMYVELV